MEEGGYIGIAPYWPDFLQRVGTESKYRYMGQAREEKQPGAEGQADGELSHGGCGRSDQDEEEAEVEVHPAPGLALALPASWTGVRPGNDAFGGPRMVDGCETFVSFQLQPAAASAGNLSAPAAGWSSPSPSSLLAGSPPPCAWCLGLD